MGRPVAVAYLHDRGGHYVLCHGKRPIWPGWQRRRPGLDTVLAHDGPLGIVPYSLGTSALDVDYGDVGELVGATAPLATLPSPRGHHCYYEDGQGAATRSGKRSGAGVRSDPLAASCGSTGAVQTVWPALYA